MVKDLAISDVARLFGLRTSAIRYYERIGILPPPLRKNGRRCYEEGTLFRLAVVPQSRDEGGSLVRMRPAFFRPNFELLSTNFSRSRITDNPELPGYALKVSFRRLPRSTWFQFSAFRRVSAAFTRSAPMLPG